MTLASVVLLSLWACASPEAEVGAKGEVATLPPQCDQEQGAGGLVYAEIGAEAGLLDTDDDDQDGQDQGAVAMADFDGDGDDDLLIGHRTSGVWYQENRDGELGLILASPMLQVAMIGVFDLENDGDLDWIAGGAAADLVVMENDGGGAFTDITARTGINDLTILRAKRHAAFGDFDADGWIDIFLATTWPDEMAPVDPHAPLHHQLFRNEGGEFRNVSSLLPPAAMVGNGWDAVWTDYDQDGDPDIYVAHSDQDRLIPSALLRNDGPGAGGSWQFTEVNAACQCVETGPTMGVTAGDFDSDGWPDLFVNATGPHHLLRNLGDGTFIDATAAWNAWGTSEPRVMSFGSVLADLDNDTRLDLFTTTGPLRSGGIETQPDDQPDHLLLHAAPGTFTESAAAAGVADIGVGRGASMGMFNADGYPDLLMTNLGDPSRLYVAPCLENRALIVDLVGTRSNRFGVGARLEAHIGDQVLYREVGTGIGWAGSGHPRAWFGLGSEGMVDRLVVRWPSGIAQVVQPGWALRITVEEPE